jgi:hypothetical protein
MMNMFGCLDPLTDEDSVTIQITAVASMTVGTKTTISGEINASPAIDETGISVAITNATTGANAAAYFTQTGPASIEPKEDINIATDLGLALTPLTTIPTGTYRLTIGATAGTATSTDHIDFTVDNGTVVTTDLVAVDLTLGSWQNATLGSSLEADSMKVYTQTAAAAISADIDIWYSNDAQARDVLYSPTAAAAALHPPKNWTTKNNTQMAKVAGVNFDAIVRQAQVDSLWALVPVADKQNFHYAADGDVVILVTNLNNTRIMKFISGDGTDGGTAVMKGKKK